MYRLSRLSLRNRAVIALVSIGVLIGGVFSISSLKQEMIPSISLPMAMVTATNPGVSATLVEQQLAAPIESAIQSVPGVESTTTTSVNSVLFSIVQFTYGTDMDWANQKLTTAVTRLQQQMPSGVETNVLTGSMDDMPIMTLAVRGQDPAELEAMINDVMVPRLSRLDHVRAVDVAGFTPLQITITPRAEDMAAAGVTMDQINQVLKDNGLALPAGEVDDGTLTLTVQAGEPLATAEQLGQLPLAVTPASMTVLTDVADVVEAPEKATSYARLDGQMAVAISITKTPAGNVVDVSHAIEDEVDALQGALAEANLETAVVFDQAPFIEDSISGLMEEGLLGLGFAVVVILVFLLSVRATLVSAVSIPLSLLMAFIGMAWTGQTVNILTLGAVTIAIGRVVDDSIVVIENIKRHLSYGERKKKAIIKAVREVGGAVAASTFCTAAVFLPLAFTGGVVGELFRPFGLTVALALFASLVVALTIVPVLAYWFVRAPVAIDAADQEAQRAEAEAKERRSFWQRVYMPTLRGTLRHPWITMAVAVGVLGGTLALVPTLETNFLGDMGADMLSVTQKFEPGTSLEIQDAQAKRTESALQEVDGIDSVLSQVGGGGMMGISMSAEPETAYYLTLEEDADSSAVETAVREAVTKVTGEGVSNTSVSGGEAGMMGSTTVDLIVRATNMEALRQAALDVEQAAKDTPGAVEVANSLAADQPRVQVTVDRAKALSYGLSETAVEGMLRGLMVPAEIGRIDSPAGQVPVVLAMGPAATDVEALQNLALINTPAGPLRLVDVAKVEVTEGPVSMIRVDGERSATVAVTPESDDLGRLSTALEEAIDKLDLPAGVTVEVGGVAAQMTSAFTDLGWALVIAVVIVFIIMVATFGSLIQPFILLIAVPFAATGALLALVLTGTPLSVPAFIGLLLLVGIVVANAIVLIDLINQYRRAGRPLSEAIEEGARKRLRPILMTAAATIFALIPMALGITGGGGSFVSRPLALVVIGGLLSSTLLTLVVVPVLYRFEAVAHDKREARRANRLEARRAERLAAREKAAAASAKKK
ncbi:MAG: efflux RND transporter permease subunit [Bifidobacteriaceae bacterium]|jgi:HAE1 family hydrophobic/amphiphilic exporter-1|nr:efflux RND transporter permease subunit [Bifidobacteriaceae bacterium]